MVTFLITATIIGFVGIGRRVVFHEDSTLIVVANALRLLGYRPKPTAGTRLAGGCDDRIVARCSLLVARCRLVLQVVNQPVHAHAPADRPFVEGEWRR